MPFAQEHNNGGKLGVLPFYLGVGTDTDFEPVAGS